jgi:tetratricopeptide (TPR) repeat protein
MSSVSSKNAESYKKDDQDIKFLIQKRLWKELYEKAEQGLVSVSSSDANNACMFACLMLVSLIKLGKLELASKWLNSWSKQYGWKVVPNDDVLSLGPLETQYCLLAVEVAFRQNSESDINVRLQSHFQLRSLIEQVLTGNDTQPELWSLFLDSLDSCIVGHLLEANRIEAAVEVAKGCLERNPQDVSRQLAFFRLLLYTGDIEQASLFWKTLEPRVEQDSERHLHRGLLYIVQRRIEEAIDEWEAAALFEQNFEATLTNNIAVGFLLQGRAFEAMEKMENMLQKSSIFTLDEDWIKHICICYDMLLAYPQESKSAIQHTFARHVRESSHSKIPPTAGEQ